VNTLFLVSCLPHQVKFVLVPSFGLSYFRAFVIAPNSIPSAWTTTFVDEIRQIRGRVLPRTMPARDPVSGTGPYDRHRLSRISWSSQEPTRMRRRNWLLLALFLVLLAVGAEMGVRRWNAAKGCVQIVNQGDHAVDNLVVSYGQTKIALGSLEPGQSATVWFTPAGKGTLSLDFKQKGSPLNGFQVADFDPGQNRRDGFKLMLVVKSDVVERFMEDDENGPAELNLADRIRDWLRWAFTEPAP
jgi:hypothetical protein